MKRLAPCVLLLLAAVLTGCSSSYDANDVSFSAIKNHPSPEMRSYHSREVDSQRHLAVTNNANKRAFWNDVGRVFYTDHRSRLHPFPDVDTSGSPR